MYRHIQKLRLILLFGIILKTQITVSQDFRFGRPGLGDANFGGQFGRGGFGGGPGQFRGGGPRFQGLTPGRRNGLGFGGVIDGGTTVLGEGGTLGSRFGNGLGGANTRTMQGFGFGGNGQPARRVSPALAARRRTVAAARARAVPTRRQQRVEQAIASFNNVFNPVPIPRTTTTTTTTPRPPESVNWLGFTNPLQRRRQAATRQSFNTRNNVPRNNRRFQQQRQNSNRNVLDRRRNVGQNLGQFSQRAQNIQRFPSRTSSRRQSVNRLRPVPRLQNINNVGRAPTAPPRRVSEDSSLMREFRRQLDRRNRERIQNVQALQRASNTARLSDVRSQRFDTRQENLLDANRQFRRRPVSSNLLRDTELQPGRQSVRSDNRLALTNQQLQEMEMTLNEPGLPRTASTLGRRIQFPPSSRDIGQRSRSQLRSNTGADGSREIVVDVISDTPGRTDWSLVNDVIPTRNTRFRSQPFADTTISFDSIQNDPPRSNLQLQLGSSDFSGTTSLEIAPTDTFDFQSGLNDNLPSRAAPLELAELSSGLDWASLDNFIQQRQNQQLRVGRRAASASAAATNRLPLTSRTQPAPAVQIPGEQLTLGSVNTRQFTIPTAGSNPLTTVDTDPNFGAMGFPAAG